MSVETDDEGLAGLRVFRAEMTAEDFKSSLFPTDEILEFMGEEWPEYSGDTGRKFAQYESLHRGAIHMLRAAEDFDCPVRVSVLIDVAEDLDVNALPGDFFRRLIFVQGRIAKIGRKRPRTRERNRNIRRSWISMRGGTSAHKKWLKKIGDWKNYTDALANLAEFYGRSEKAIEAVVNGTGGGPERDDLERDHERFNAAIKRLFPKNSKPTSR